jgi:hypothetical protein
MLSDSFIPLPSQFLTLLLCIALRSGCNVTVAASYNDASYARAVSTGRSWLLPLLAMVLNLHRMHTGTFLS